MRREKLFRTKITISAQRLKPELHVLPLIKLAGLITSNLGRNPGVDVHETPSDCKTNIKHSKAHRFTCASSVGAFMETTSSPREPCHAAVVLERRGSLWIHISAETFLSLKGFEEAVNLSAVWSNFLKFE